ncbi:MAG: FAD-dependent oxidoreductase [Candidatus Thermoplasmatota archaeon]|nr:FAD-dependent oxidoreductase [Candidatus Thermoplasmatota archaeon]
MSEFDAIVVGAGPAGSSAAIRMANKKLNVLLVERADPPGSKNVSGGILWGNALAEIIPEWEKDIPLERLITHKGTTFLTKDSSISIDFRSTKFLENHSGYSVLRARMDNALANSARKAGAMVVTGVTVDRVAKEEGKVVGVEQDGEIITSDAVILAEGANPRVAIDSGLRKPIGDQDVAIGVKQIIRLPENTINERFNLKGSEGFAGEYVLSYLEGEAEAGGFLYTNKDTISIGAVISSSKLREDGQTHSYDIMESFVQHPHIAPLLEGGKLEEYSAHLVCEGGIDSVPRIYGDGYLIAGDAAGFSFSNGLMIQGMNYAITSGIAAADTVIEAKERGNFSSDSLASYERKLEDSYVLKDLKNFRNIDKVTWSRVTHRAIPKIAENLLYSMYHETGRPKKHLMQMILESSRDSGMSKSQLILESYRMMRRM